jgi:hypothetical protein
VLDNLKSGLVSKYEINYILNSKVLSKSFEYKIKSQLKKKVSIFLNNEFPLLLPSGLISFTNLPHFINYSNMLLRPGKK